MKNHKQETIDQLAEELLSGGFRVFIAKSGTHGFYTDDEGARVVSFQVNYLSPSFSGNYESSHSGSGWGLDVSQSYKDMLYCGIPSWVGRDNFKMVTLDKQLERYQKTSQYKEITK